MIVMLYDALCPSVCSVHLELRRSSFNRHSLLGRIAVAYYVDVAYSYRPSSVVCLSVGPSVGLSVCLSRW